MNQHDENKCHSPARLTFTRQELLDRSRTWMKEHSVDVGCTHEYYYTRLGLLIDFVTNLFDEPPAHPPERSRPVTDGAGKE